MSFDLPNFYKGLCFSFSVNFYRGVRVSRIKLILRAGRLLYCFGAQVLGRVQLFSTRLRFDFQQNKGLRANQLKRISDVCFTNRHKKTAHVVSF